MAKVAIAQEPDEFARGCVLHLRGTKVGCVADTTRVFPVTLGAMLKVKFFSGKNRVRIAFVGIFPVARFCRRLCDREQDTAVVGSLLLVVRGSSNGGCGNHEQYCGNQGAPLHWNKLRTLRPKPLIS